MRFVRYEKVEEFMKENFELILEKEWLNCLMVGNCLEAQKTGTDGWLLAKVTQNTKTELMMLYRKPWKLIMYSPTENLSEELYKFAAEEVYKRDNNLLGVNAETEIANKFAKYYCEVANKKYRLHTPMKILVLEKMLPMQKANEATFRQATEDDRKILTKYIKQFNEEALTQEMTDEEANKKCKAYLERGYYVLEKDKKIVSQAVIGRELIKGKSVSGVYTPKEERGKGYAYNLVYTLSKKCLDEGAKYCVLYTDAENPISNHVYEKIGYVKRVECEELEFYE
ncbi:MAG: GNAT family N-acetyltransferase [Clostridia bacterium]|nr:GNAT family N-acetyltransferase [Clostridia bacterium]